MERESRAKARLCHREHCGACEQRNECRSYHPSCSFMSLTGRLVTCSGRLPTLCADACKQLRMAHAELQGKRWAFEGAAPFPTVSPCQEVPEGEAAVLMILPKPVSNTKNWIICFGMLTQQQTTQW